MSKEQIVTLTDQDGNPQEFKILDIIMVEDREFIVAISELDGEDALYVLEVVEDGGEVIYSVPDRDVCEAVVEIFAEENDQEENGE